MKRRIERVTILLKKMHRIFVPLFMLSVTMATMGGLLRRREAPANSGPSDVDSNGQTWWCDAVGQSDTSTRTKSIGSIIRTEGYSMFGFINNSVLRVSLLEGLEEKNESRCGAISFFSPPQTNHTATTRKLQKVADKMWELGQAIALYRMAVRKLELQGALPEEDVPTLTVFDIMIHHYANHVERYLQASKCSCQNAKCTIHLDMNVSHLRHELSKDRSSSCTSQLLLGKIVQEIRGFVSKLYSLFNWAPYSHSQSFCADVKNATSVIPNYMC